MKIMKADKVFDRDIFLCYEIEDEYGIKRCVPDDPKNKDFRMIKDAEKDGRVIIGEKKFRD